jgi:hypothetical protein
MTMRKNLLIAASAAVLLSLLACGPLSFGGTKSLVATTAAKEVRTATPGSVASGACKWTGTWDTTYGAMELVQKGSNVTGTYESDGGKIKGSVAGKVFTGIWSEQPDYKAPDNAGDMKFTMASDCQSFTGQWRYGTEGDYSDWEGTRTASGPTG